MSESIPEPVTGEPVAPKSAERPHPLTPLIELWVVLVAAVFFVARDLIEHPDRLDRGLLGALGIPALIAGGVALLFVAFSFVTWLTTRFVIDEDEVRLEKGWLNRRSTKVRFDRIQSVELHQALAARLVGAAELRIEAGAGSGGLALKYLTRARANELRAIMLRRAHAVAAGAVPAPDPATDPGADPGADLGADPAPATTTRLDDRAEDEEVVVRLPAAQIALAALASPEVVLAVLALLVVVGLQLWSGVTGLAVLGALIPFLLLAWSLLSGSLLSQLNYSLARSSRGLRVTRGLTNLTSQNFPLDRVQGVRVSRSILHRPLGLWRVHVDILGTRRVSEEKGASALLLPAATTPQLDLVLAHLLPGVDLDDLPLAAPPRRAVWLLGPWRRTRRWAVTDRVTVAQQGWLHWTRDIVPHEKVQSVELSDGPFSRALGLATVHVQNTPGPVDLHIVDVDAGVAGTLLLDVMARGRAARATSPR